VHADIEAAADGVGLGAVEFKQVIAAFNDIITASANGVSGAAFAASRNAMLNMEGISMVTLLVGIALAFVLAISFTRPLPIFYSCAVMLMIFSRPG